MAEGLYAPAMALNFLTDRCGMTDLQLARDYRLNRCTLARIRKGERLTRAYDYYLRRLTQAVLKRQELALLQGNIDLKVEISELIYYMFKAHLELLSDVDFQRMEFVNKFVAQ